VEDDPPMPRIAVLAAACALAEIAILAISVGLLVG
jgi:hypothetical protein